ncbi:unnamed protein product [Rotaria sordida]|uniref:NHL repeat-containing protein n=1 Tax=Rotaria sordida TaxID=392033 RepID=A0A819NTF9_9BILA|nr:unnamed protein product [Rotaria sordida]
MLEPTIASVQPISHQEEVTVQTNRLLRWWMRHYHHIGLASLAGSAILVCIMAVILLPIVIHNSTKDSEQCVTLITTTMTMSSILIDPLCAANAIWKSQAVTIVGSSDRTNSLSRSHLKDPNDMLIDTNGNLFIADSGNNRVVYLPVNATEGRIVAGRSIRESLFKYAAATVAWKDQLYVSDLGNYRILAFPLSTTEGSPDGTTIVGRYGVGSPLNQIDSVYYMSIDRMRELFYLSDFRNNRILKLNLTDNTLQLAVGTGISGSNNVSLNLPLGITIDETTGSLYVTDSRNHRVQKFNLNSIQGITVAGGTSHGQNLFHLNLPSSVAIDPHGNVYIADSGNHRIVQWLVNAHQGRIIAGTGIAGISNTQLNHPVQLKFDIHHNLYVVDQNNNRIQRFDLQYNGC